MMGNGRQRWKMIKLDSCYGGYALIDVLMALFLFSMSFIVLYGLTETSNIKSQQATNLTKAVNIAWNTMERLSGQSWAENLAKNKCIPGDTVVGSEGLFEWAIYADWDIYPELLEVETEVKWLENGKIRSYHLGSLYYVD
jgi:hypothetical protein